ncbi:uncharacterized protein LY79DRAFT_665190 [Colletotrichum navitas]|uniref:FAD dependent oxidoreductase domain-containing protein n=1 Tax=Colletotrichum navitas TaxID=681940 RepID=A0AAD8VBY0_9PEZI|nr:uncharacterized protein LY79DRAFT_665190 [Colletotrichum navitas]KAK1599538.1 hypothetical protein LY79DRAFT_665190 [Colletotrichum navitas]
MRSCGMQLFTHTLALSVTPAAPAADGSPRWRVGTPRGTIWCANVFHATTGYVSHLLPGFLDKDSRGGRQAPHLRRPRPRPSTGLHRPLGDWDDSTTTPDIIRSLTEFSETHMAVRTGAGPPCYAWSGIMGLTPDELPYVGAVPDCAGQWVAAGYSGHGMARAFMTAQALIQLFAQDDVDSRVPAEYFKIAERLARKDDEWDQVLERNLKANPPPVV